MGEIVAGVDDHREPLAEEARQAVGELRAADAAGERHDVSGEFAHQGALDTGAPAEPAADALAVAA